MLIATITRLNALKISVKDNKDSDVINIIIKVVNKIAITFYLKKITHVYSERITCDF